MTKEFDARNERKSRSVCAAMAEAADTGKRVLTEREREILDMWPRFGDTGECAWFGDAVAAGVANITVEAIEFTAQGAYVKDGQDGDWSTSVPAEGRLKRSAPEVLDADGVRIREGDTVWIIPALTDTPDEPHEVIGINSWGEVLLEFHTEGSTGLKGEYLTHTRPDSWERLEEDAVKVVCEYAGAVPDEFGDYDCDTCRLFDARGKLICEQQMALNIVRRAKALAGVEVDG